MIFKVLITTYVFEFPPYFKEASIGGKQYPVEMLRSRPKTAFSKFANDRGKEEGGGGDPEEEERVNEFLTALAVCHTVQVAEAEDLVAEAHVNQAFVDDMGATGPTSDTKFIKDRLEYNAASPDEKALVEACEQFGVQVTCQDLTCYFPVYW